MDLVLRKVVECLPTHGGELLLGLGYLWAFASEVLKK